MGKSQLIISANLLSSQRNSQPNKSHKIQGILVFIHHFCISILSTFISAHPTFVNQNSYSTIPRIANFGNSFYTTSSFFFPHSTVFFPVSSSLCVLSPVPLINLIYVWYLHLRDSAIRRTNLTL